MQVHRDREASSRQSSLAHRLLASWEARESSPVLAALMGQQHPQQQGPSRTRSASAGPSGRYSTQSAASLVDFVLSVSSMVGYCGGGTADRGQHLYTPLMS